MATDPDRARRSLPIKCTACERTLDSPFFCNACKRLYPADGLNYFELFELPPHYALDPAVLRGKYFELSRSIHPDATAEAGDAVQRLSLRVSARLNQAFRVLRDPVLRAEYLLELFGGKAASEDKQVAPDVLNETLLLREEIAEAQTEQDDAALATLQDRVAARCAELEQQIGEQAAHLPGSAETRTTLRRTLNAHKYFDKMRSQCGEAEQ